jgi:hypothetical protein
MHGSHRHPGDVPRGIRASSRGFGFLAAVLLAAAGAASLFVSAGLASAQLRVCASGCTYSTVGAALADARAGDRILVDSGTFAGGLTIDKNILIRGAGSDRTAIALGGDVGGGSVITVSPGAVVTLSGLRVSGGFAQLGAGIRNDGDLTLRDVTVRDNNGFGPGAAGTIFNGATGTLTMINSRVTNNIVVDGIGGGIYNLGRAQLKRSLVDSNGAEFVGAGIYNDLGATMSLVDMVVSNNFSAMAAGGIENRGTISLQRTTIRHNAARTFGGGLLNEGNLVGALTTLTENTAGWGGGIYNGGNATFRNSTVTMNTAQVEGGGILNVGALQLFSTKVIANDPDNCFGC